MNSDSRHKLLGSSNDAEDQQNTENTGRDVNAESGNTSELCRRTSLAWIDMRIGRDLNQTIDSTCDQAANVTKIIDDLIKSKSKD